MIHEYYFQRENIADIVAAIVGVSRRRWIAIDEKGASLTKAIATMSRYSFDILPIEAGSKVREYYATTLWGDYTSVTRRQINHRDTREFSTHIREVIRDFAQGSRFFYFLTAENDIVGLVTVVNLNCRAVQVYLFGLLCELESLIALELGRSRTEEQLIKLFKGQASTRRREQVMNRFNMDRQMGTDASFSEYLFFSDLVGMMNLVDWNGLPIRELPMERCREITRLRNSIAHPTKSLIRKPEDIGWLWDLIDSIEEMLFHLRGLTREPEPS